MKKEKKERSPEKRDNEQIFSWIGTLLVLITCFVINVYVQWMPFELQAFVAVSMLVVALIVLIHPFLRTSTTPSIVWVAVAGCFIYLAFALISFCSVMPYQFKDSTIAIISSSVGGAFTLYGIGITIKHERLQKKQEDVERAKPNVFVISSAERRKTDEFFSNRAIPKVDSALTETKEANKKDTLYRFKDFSLANSDLAMCSIQGLTINDSKPIVFKYDSVLLRGGSIHFYIDYTFAMEEDPMTIELVLGDMLGNLYSCQASFEIEGDTENEKIKKINILGVYNPVPTNSKVAETFLKRRMPPKSKNESKK